MDPLGYATHHLQISARFSYINIQGYHAAGLLFLMVVEGVIRGKLGLFWQFLEKTTGFIMFFYHKNPYLGFFDVFFEVLNRGGDLSHVDLKNTFATCATRPDVFQMAVRGCSSADRTPSETNDRRNAKHRCLMCQVEIL